MGKNKRLNPSLEPKDVVKMRQFLESRVIGQSRAIDRLVSSFSMSLTCFKPKEKPIFVGLFLGPSGVGKTEIAERLSEFLLDDRNGRVKFACSELSESFQISRLIGSPPGYVGFYEDDDRGRGVKPGLHQDIVDEAGRRALAIKARSEDPESSRIYRRMQEIRALINQSNSPEDRKDLREELNKTQKRFNDRIDELVWERHPHSIILFDEIEKADPSIHKLLLEISSKGVLTMSNNDQTIFDQSFIILTSNIGSRDISDLLRGRGHPGFVAPGVIKRDAYEVAMDALKKEFPPELIGRIKENIVVFRPLGEVELRQILDLRVRELVRKIFEDSNIVLRIGSKIKDFIFSESCDHPEYGARLIEDKLNRHILEPLSRLSGTKQINTSDIVLVDYSKNDGIVVFYRENKPQEDFPEEIYEEG